MERTPAFSSLRPRLRLRFGLGTLLTVVLVLSLLLAWWRDHRDLAASLEFTKARTESLEDLFREQHRVGGRNGSFGGMASSLALQGSSLQDSFADADDYVDFVLTTSDFSEAESTFYLLPQYPYAQHVVERLLQQKGSPQVQVRRRVAHAFQRIALVDDSNVRDLATMLNDPDYEVQQAAIRAITEHGQRAASALPTLRVQAANDHSPIAVECLWAINTIEPMSDIGPRLIELLQHEHTDCRRQAVQSLPRYVPRETVTAVLTNMYFREPDGSIKKAIILAINQARISGEH